MTYVVTNKCIGTKDRACVEVCPVDCFYDFQDGNLNEKFGKPAKKRKRKDGTEYDDVGMLVINPDECINCGACETECPVGAIEEDIALSSEDEEWIEVNAKAVQDMDLDECRVTCE